MQPWLKLAFKELKNNSRFTFFFLINFTIGLVGFITLDSFKTSLDNHLSLNSKAILTGDISLTANREFNTKELLAVEKIIGNNFKRSKQVSFFSMAAGNNSSRLIQVTAIDPNFPLYGEMVLENSGKIDDSFVKNELLQNRNVWAYRELLMSLRIKKKDTIKIGHASFVVPDVIIDDPGSFISAFSLAPKIYMGINQLEDTGLIKSSSRVRYTVIYRFLEEKETEILARKIVAKFEELYGNNPGIRVQTHIDASRQLGKTLGYLNDYLGLIALIALFLAGLGAAYLYRNFISGRFREMAIMNILGAQKMETYKVAIFQLITLGFISSICAVFLAITLLPLFTQLLAGFLPKGFSTDITGTSIPLSFFMGIFGSFIFCLPVLTKIEGLKPALLLHENVLPTKSSNKARFRSMIAYLPGFILFWLLAIIQANSWIVGSLFIFLFALALIFLGFVGWILFIVCGKLSNTMSVSMKIVLRNLYRNRYSGTSCFLAIALGAMLTTLIPMIQNGLQEEFSKPKGLKVPSFFLFDIQPEQVNPLKMEVMRAGYSLTSISPMIRARLEKINLQEFDSNQSEKTVTREQERERQFRNRTINLSYRTTLHPEEHIVEGKPFSGKYD
ncbi:MAG: hypothetical protein HQK84_05600, partial [Nitrospinae bacterium]|nr:hypothetical protein [Nitrospinota bacterium]